MALNVRDTVISCLDSLCSRNADLTNQLVSKNNRITSLEAEFDEFKQEVDARIDSVVAENTSLKADVSQKEQRVSQLEHENVSLKRDLAATMWSELSDSQKEEVKRFAISLRAPPPVPPAPPMQPAPPAFGLPPPAAMGSTYLDKFASTGFAQDQLLLLHWGSGVRSFVFAKSWPHATTDNELHLQTVVSLGPQPGFTTIPFDEINADLTTVTASTAAANCAAVFNEVNLKALFESDVKVFDRSLGMIMLPFEQYANTVKMQSLKAVLALPGVTKTSMNLSERRVSANALTSAWVDSLFQDDSVSGGAHVLASMAGAASSASLSSADSDDVEDEVEDEVYDVDAVKVESDSEDGRYDLNDSDNSP